MKTDTHLYNDVSNKLRFEPSIIDHEKISVAVHDGIVMLGGVVTNYNQKITAENAIKSIEGTKGVVNEIKVEAPPQYLRDDVSIAKAAVNALAWNSEIALEGVKVVVETGVLKLYGEARWHYQKKAAETCVRNLYGIKDIINLIEVKPSVSPIEVKNKITEDFKRNALIDASKIEVETEGNTVTLRGKVRSWAEMKEAVEAAWAVSGISYVNNQLRI